MLTSLPDLLIIGGAALLVFGPKKLPELGSALGKSIRDFKKALNEDDEPTHAQLPSGSGGESVSTPKLNG